MPSTITSDLKKRLDGNPSAARDLVKKIAGGRNGAYVQSGIKLRAVANPLHKGQSGHAQAAEAARPLAEGDRVRCVAEPFGGGPRVGDTGTVRVGGDGPRVPYGVEWDRTIAVGHNLDGACPDGRGWWMRPIEIVRIPADAADAADAPAVPQSGEDVARMMREAWPLSAPARWEAFSPVDVMATAKCGEVGIYVDYDAEHCVYHASLEPGVYDGAAVAWDSGDVADLPALVSALRAAHAALLADLRALAPADATPEPDDPEVIRLRAEVARLIRERDEAVKVAREAIAWARELLMAAWSGNPPALPRMQRARNACDGLDARLAALTATTKATPC